MPITTETTTTYDLLKVASVTLQFQSYLHWNGIFSIHLPLSVVANGVIAVTGAISSDWVLLLTTWSNFSLISFTSLVKFWLADSKASILTSRLLTTSKIFGCPMTPEADTDYSEYDSANLRLTENVLNNLPNGWQLAVLEEHRNSHRTSILFHAILKMIFFYLVGFLCWQVLLMS